MTLCASLLASAADPTIEPGSGLVWVDWLVIVLYAAGTIALGWYFSRRQGNTHEYFIGKGNMSPLLVGISLFATLLSTISFLAIPGEMIKHGPVYLAGYLSVPLSFIVVGYWLIPHFMRQRVTSAYELLEAKLGLSARLLGAVMFIWLRLVWMSLLVFMASSALVIMFGVAPENQSDWIPLVTLVTGLVAITYTALGGLRAVIITDFLQFCLLLGGALLVIAMISFNLGGLDWWPSTWHRNWDSQPLFSFDPHTRITIIGALVMQLIFRVSTAGGDQTAVQRYMATADAAAARRSFLVNCIVGVVIALVLMVVGFALLGFYETHPELIPGGNTIASEADNLFPHFIAHRLPAGLSGLVVAAMFAAAMSSIDSGVNSITAVVSRDFLERFGRYQQADNHRRVRAAQKLAFGIGLVVVCASSLMQYVPGNFLEMTKRTTNLLTTPIFGVFVMALFIPFATVTGTWVGTILGFAAAVLVAFWGPITGLESISFMWIGATALTVQLTVGLLVSAVTHKRTMAQPVD
jgi:SSS family solute:Na+ symporter